MKRALQILLPIFILGTAVGIAAYMIFNQKEAPRRQFQAPPREVVVRPLELESYQVELLSQGSVRARTTSTLIPEVRGRIVDIGPNFQEGAFFEKGEILVEIDQSDYETELIVAEAALAQAELRLVEEQARSAQAKRDWERLNPNTPATSLTLREPQLKQAAASAASAQARVNTAKLNMERTKIRAPFAGRMLSKNVDVGQYVSPGNQMARIFAVDLAEVRLPLTATQFSFLDMEETYRGENPNLAQGPAVELSLEVGGQKYFWRGRVARSEGAVDTRSRQLFVVAQIRNPYGRTANDRPPLKVGSFVEASISGRVLEDVFLVPRNLVRENTYVLMVDRSEGRDVLRRRDVSIIWETDEVAVVNGGLKEGEFLCLTQVPLALEEYPVTAVLESELPEPEEGQSTPVRRGPPTSGAGGGGGGGAGGGGPAAGILAALPPDKPLPPELKAKLDDAMAALQNGDRSKMRPVMGEIREWAAANGIELPAGGGRGGR
ncbi:MAG: efflux RND transporter periplasmic adaptor subunit [Synoicihabitans sp.]